MSLAVNPRIVSEGLVYYIDPNTEENYIPFFERLVITNIERVENGNELGNYNDSITLRVFFDGVRSDATQIAINARIGNITITTNRSPVSPQEITLDIVDNSLIYVYGIETGFDYTPRYSNTTAFNTDTDQFIPMPVVPTPTPTQTVTPTPSITLTVTPTPSLTVTLTPTPTITQTPTLTPGPTPCTDEIQYLIVAGGGGGGTSWQNFANAAGGAGGLIQGCHDVTLNVAYAITVGAGGGYDVNGSNSTIGIIPVTAIGGGTASANGGSGGGSGGIGTVGQGNDGGGNDVFRSSGGGGGAATDGFDGAYYSGGNGGLGLYLPHWSNATVTGHRPDGNGHYAGGGGGGGANQAGGTSNCLGGVGGGGNGGYSGLPGTNALVNTGGGGGGSYSGANPGQGGSGLVIIRYLGTTIKATGGVIVNDGVYTYHTFTTSGTFTKTIA